MEGSICRGTNVRYQARVRPYGHRRYVLIGKPSTSFRVALERMVDAFAENGAHRADVVMTAEYYEPVVLCDLVRR